MEGHPKKWGTQYAEITDQILKQLQSRPLTSPSVAALVTGLDNLTHLEGEVWNNISRRTVSAEDKRTLSDVIEYQWLLRVRMAQEYNIPLPKLVDPATEGDTMASLAEKRKAPVKSAVDSPGKAKRAKKQKGSQGHNLLLATHVNPADIAIFYDEDHELGEGTFGKVYSGTYVGRTVAVKFLEPLKDDDRNRRLEANLATEASLLLARGGHDNVLKYIGFMKPCGETRGRYALVTELCETPEGHNNLGALLRDYSIHLDDYTRIKLARDVARGLRWLHEAFQSSIVHRDIATKNLLLTSPEMEEGNFLVKVGDLGLAAEVSKRGKLRKAAGTPLTRAPEVLNNDGYSVSADVYSFAAVLWEVWTRQSWEETIVATLEVQDEAHLRAKIVDENYRPPIPKDAPAALRRLLRDCWQTTPSRRPAMKTVLETLDNILLTLAIEDRVGRELWQRQFGNHERVLWVKFLAGMYAHLELGDPPSVPNDDAAASGAYPFAERGSDMTTFLEELTRTKTDQELDMLCIRLLVARKYGTEDLYHVHIRRFGKFLRSYGSLANGESFMHGVGELCRQKWFHGSVNNDRRLPDTVAGTFAVRESGSVAGAFTLSVSNGRCKEPTCMRFGRNPTTGAFPFPWDQSQTTTSLVEYVDAIKAHGALSVDGHKVSLLHPAEGSPFSDIFEFDDEEWSAPGG